MSAYDYKPVLEPGAFNGWDIFHIEYEMQRQHMPSNCGWKTSFLNASYEVIPTYPNKLIVPDDVNDDQLLKVVNYRSKGRIPVLTYYHEPNTATITRCSQPLAGITGSTCIADEQLLESIRKANHQNPSILQIYDCRPKANAVGNQAMGLGYEATGVGTGYLTCALTFLNIANIHVMRVSLQRVYVLLTTTVPEERYLSQLEATGWLNHISLVIDGALKIAEKIDRENISVMVHCSDGWDRTAQVCGLAQILLSDTYRTIEGFELLIEKDWLSFGHHFHQRCGHGFEFTGSWILMATGLFALFLFFHLSFKFLQIARFLCG